ncbi:hypothetical protein JQX13_28525 [Archangium violaceum]|uniref:hypothetical protein n=1 Tax=Archangium violaceum TaxID=83451 RepID=UPI00193C51D8|nr:hypothetical protein [Archangium violaceum]QRK04214.1 hypothetical protein JQX13_28525 [Archangium violaceum]
MSDPRGEFEKARDDLKANLELYKEIIDLSVDAEVSAEQRNNAEDAASKALARSMERYIASVEAAFPDVSRS